MNIPANALGIIELIKRTELFIGAELGVRRGEFTRAVANSNSNIRIYAVDIWQNHESLNENHNHKDNYEAYLLNIKEVQNQITTLKGLTTDMHCKVPDNSLDWIFIDATHTYEGLKHDLLSWLPKVKDTGIITGHDYCEEFDNGGLKRAIDEFVGIDKVYPRTEEDSRNILSIVDDICTHKLKVADSQTGCWYAWKNLIKYLND